MSSSVVEGFEPIYKVFSVPFVFQSDEHRFQVLDGAIGEQVLDAGRSIRLQGLTYYDAGTRSFYTKDRPVHHPDDLKGLKIRVQESPAAIQMVNMLGGSATPISWSLRFRTPRSSTSSARTMPTNTSHSQTGWPRNSAKRSDSIR